MYIPIPNFDTFGSLLTAGLAMTGALKRTSPRLFLPLLLDDMRATLVVMVDDMSVLVLSGLSSYYTLIPCEV